MAYASGNKAKAFCDRCGFQYKLHDLRDEVVDMHETGLKVCPECWDPDQPQLQVGRWPVNDPQALRSPRPNGQDGGREDGWLVYDFKESAEGWRTGYGTVTHNPDTESITWSYDFDADGGVEAPTISIEDGESLSYGTTDFAVNTALYRYVRFRVRLLENPDPINLRKGSASLSWFRFSNYSEFDTPLSASSVPAYSTMGSDVVDLIFDMNDKNGLGSENIAWTGTLRRMRLSPFTMVAGSSFKMEFLGIYFEPIRVQPDNSLQNGVENWDFTTPVFQKNNSSAFTTQGGDKIESVPGWTVTESHGFSGNGSSKGNIGIAENNPDYDYNPRLYIRPWIGHTTKASQVTSKVIEGNTKYTLNVPISGSTEGANHMYAIRLKSGGSLLSETTGTEPSTGKFTTRTVSYATSGSDSNIGSPLEIEIANVATNENFEIHTQLSAERVELVESPQFTYDFLTGTATATAGSGTYGIEGWAHWDSGKNPIDGSLVWDSSTKTVKLETPSLGASNPWDVPEFTYWDTKSPGVSADISTSKYSRVSVRIRKTSSGASSTKVWKGRFYFVQSSRVESGLFPFSSNEEISEPSFVLNEWEELTWDLSQNSKWLEEGTATGFRFDFYRYDDGDTSTKDIFEIDYVRFN
jgi:hypothetical protein